MGSIRERRRETAKQVKAAKTKAKEGAHHATRLSRKAHKAEVKAAGRDRKHQHKLELKEVAGRVRSEEKLGKKELKLGSRALKRAGKMRKTSAKGEKRVLAARQRHQTEIAEKVLEQQRNQGFTKDKTKSWIGGTHLLVPILVPLAYRAITAVQRRKHSAAAQKFDVSAGDTTRYQRHGAPLFAHIEATRGSLIELRKSGAESIGDFIKDANSRLNVMADTISVTKKMTPERRRRAHHSITAELDSLDRQIIPGLGA